MYIYHISVYYVVLFRGGCQLGRLHAWPSHCSDTGNREIEGSDLSCERKGAQRAASGCTGLQIKFSVSVRVRRAAIV